MLKQNALDLLGGTVAASRAIGVTPQSVSDWPEVLPPRIGDRVIAALVRAGREVPQELLRQPAPAQPQPQEGQA